MNKCTSCFRAGRGEQDKKYCCVNPSYPTLLDRVYEQCGSYIKRNGPMLTLQEQDQKYGNKYFGTRGKRND